MNFSEPDLITFFGSWMRVQVAFYDFVFQKASNLCAAHWKELALEEISNQFVDGGDLYERTVSWIEQNYATPELAWQDFKDSLLLQVN